MQTVISAVIYVIANAVGLLLAALIIPEFTIDFWSFLIVVVVFSAILAVLTPIIRKLSEKNAPALMGGLSLVAIFACLLVTDLVMEGMGMGGLVNWIAATVLIWLGSLAATLILPRFLHTKSKPGA